MNATQKGFSKRHHFVLDLGKEYLAEFRLSQLARREGFPSLQSLVAQLRGQPSGELIRRVVEVMTTNETSFFRDHHPFEAMRTHILPELLQKRAGERKLNLWCAAASSGQEPYSIAMLLREQCAPPAGWDLRFMATDLSREMLTRAQQGRYSMLEVNRGLPAPYLVKYFNTENGDYQIKPEMRQMINFCELNLVEAWPSMPPMDIIFLRNVLIYFDVEKKKEILAKMRKILRPDGYLFLGGAETTHNLDSEFRKVQIGKASCYQRS